MHPLSFCKTFLPTFSMVYLLHGLHGVDASGNVQSLNDHQFSISGWGKKVWWAMVGGGQNVWWGHAAPVSQLWYTPSSQFKLTPYLRRLRHRAHYGTTLRHPLERKYTTYCNGTRGLRGGPGHS